VQQQLIQQQAELVLLKLLLLLLVLSTGATLLLRRHLPFCFQVCRNSRVHFYHNAEGFHAKHVLCSCCTCQHDPTVNTQTLTQLLVERLQARQAASCLVLLNTARPAGS
jgi:hypothetical protein